MPMKWGRGRGLAGLILSLSLCCFVVPLRDLVLVTTFNAASFCVAFFPSLLYMEKLIHVVDVMKYNNNSNNNNNNDEDDDNNTPHSNNR